MCVLVLPHLTLANSDKVKTLFGWKTTSGFMLREFGDKGIHPRYKGDVLNQKPNGLGIMTFPSGRRYLGEWNNGKREGHGTETFPNGVSYIGVFKNDFMWNVIKYDNEGKYLGEFKNGVVWNGIVYDKNGNFIGKWNNGVKQR